MVKQRQILNFHEFLKNSNVLNVLDILVKEGFEAYLAGGAVRDMLLGKLPYDFDIASNARPKDIKRLFPHHTNRGERFGTISVIVNPKKTEAKDTEGVSGSQLITEVFEITTYRSEDVYKDSRHPDQIKFADSILEDSKRRDFTINAMYSDIKGNVSDPQNGLEDLDSKLISTVGDPSERFTEDALRVLRAFRFSSQLGFEIEKKSLSAAIDQWSNISKVSAERIYVEFKKMIVGKNFENILPVLIKNNLFEYFVESKSDLSVNYLLERIKTYPDPNQFCENFLLDLSLTQKTYFEFYLNSWKDFLPLRRSEKVFLDEAFHFIKYLDVFKKNFQKVKILDVNTKDPEPYIGRAIRLALNVWSVEDIKIMVNKHFLDQLDLDPKFSESMIDIISRLKPDIEPLVTGKDLILAGEMPGPSLREKLNLAYEFQLEEQQLTIEELLKR